MLKPNFVRTCALVVIAAMVGFSAPAIASSVTTYSDLASFNAATAGGATVDFAGLAGGSYVHYGSSITVGGVTFTDNQARLFVLSPSYPYGTTTTSEFLNNNSIGTSVGIDFPSPVYGFALDFGSLFNWGNTSSNSDTFTFAGNSETVSLPGYLYTGEPGSVSPLFIGFTSDTPFTHVTISDPSQSLSVTDLTYATNLSGGTVPEPTSIALLGIALAGLGATRRKKPA